MPEPGEVAATFDVNVTGCPKTLGVTLVLTVVPELAWLTTCATAEEVLVA